MNYFRNLIICKDCSSKLNKEVRYNRKSDSRTKSIYHLCSRRKNYKDCSQPILREEDLLDVIKRHLDLQGKEKKFSIEKLKLFVLRIDVENESVVVRYRDGTTSKISENEIIF